MHVFNFFVIMFPCWHVYLVMRISIDFAFDFTINSRSPSRKPFSHSWRFFCLILLVLLAGFLLLNQLFGNRHSCSHPLKDILSYLFPQHVFTIEPSHALYSPTSLLQKGPTCSFQTKCFTSNSCSKDFAG